MKTTLELPDDLLIEAKTAAARRRTTLRALMESALRREISRDLPQSDEAAFLRLDPGEPPCLKARGARVTSKMVYQMLDAEGC